MKTILILAVCVFCSTKNFAATNLVKFNLADFTTAPVSFKQIKITPMPSSFPRAEGTQVVGVDPVFKTTDANGLTTNLMVEGDYSITFTGRFVATTFRITTPSTNCNCLLNASALTSAGTNLPGNLSAYSQSASDGRFALRTNAIMALSTNFVRLTNGVAGGVTNLNFRSNIVAKVTNGVVTIDVIASGSSGVSDATLVTASNAVLSGASTNTLARGIRYDSAGAYASMTPDFVGQLLLQEGLVFRHGLATTIGAWNADFVFPGTVYSGSSLIVESNFLMEAWRSTNQMLIKGRSRVDQGLLQIQSLGYGSGPFTALEFTDLSHGLTIGMVDTNNTNPRYLNDSAFFEVFGLGEFPMVFATHNSSADVNHRRLTFGSNGVTTLHKWAVGADDPGWAVLIETNGTVRFTNDIYVAGAITQPLMTASRVAVYSAGKQLTNDIAETGIGALVRSNSPSLRDPTFLGTVQGVAAFDDITVDGVNVATANDLAAKVSIANGGSVNQGLTNAVVSTNLLLGTRSVLTNNDATTNIFIGPVTRAGGVTIGPGGNVGVNKAVPTVALDVTGAIVASGAITATGSRVTADNAVLTSYFTIGSSSQVPFGTTNGFANSSAVPGTGSILASNLMLRGALSIGPSGATLTNTLYVSATLDFPSTVAGTVSDLPITVAGAADGDIVALGEPSASIGPLTGVYDAWASNGVVYVRFANNNLITAQDPASGTFRVRVDKFQ